MLVAEEFFSWNARENKAIARLCSALDEVVATGKPSPVQCFPESFTTPEFVKIAVDLCARAELNVAVLGNPPAKSLTLVPLRVAPVRRRSAPPSRALGPLAAAGIVNHVVI